MTGGIVMCEMPYIVHHVVEENDQEYIMICEL